MSVEFVRNPVGVPQLSTARRQQKQLAYFTQSSVQENISSLDYSSTVIAPEYTFDDHFLNWVHKAFKADNFISFKKYLRFPLPSSGLIHEEVLDHLQRVEYSEDAYFRYTISGETSNEPPQWLNSQEFNKCLFNALLFRFNDILVHDRDESGNPIRFLVSIDDVKSIESHKGCIKRIAYSVERKKENGEREFGYLYIDNKEYIYYDKEYNEGERISHDLGVCPASYISGVPFGNEDVVRASVFSRSRADFEEYTFLKTLQKLTDPNGAFPIVTMPKTSSKGNPKESKENNIPMAASSISGQGKKEPVTDLQAGSVHKMAVISDPQTGKADMEVVKNFFTFHRMPVETLEYVDKRIKSLERQIITSLVGDYQEGDEMAKNRKQIIKSYDAKQNKVRNIASQMTRVRSFSDEIMLGLQHGINNVIVDLSYGTDFFIETQEELFTLFEAAPNPIERRNLLLRAAQIRGKHNNRRAKRDEILYLLLPYSSDLDFEKALEAMEVDIITKQKQLQFSYFVSYFEATYGDLVSFWGLFPDQTDAQILQLVNKLLDEIILTHGTSKDKESSESSES